MKEAAYDEVFHSQVHYRALVDCMARPGKVNRFEPVPLSPPARDSTVQALTSHSRCWIPMSRFARCYSSEGVASYLRANTNAHGR